MWRVVSAGSQETGAWELGWYRCPVAGWLAGWLATGQDAGGGEHGKYTGYSVVAGQEGPGWFVRPSKKGTKVKGRGSATARDSEHSSPVKGKGKDEGGVLDYRDERN